jgi:general secretion pathway protein D
MVPESLKLSRLVDLTAEITGQPFSYNAQELSAITVSLRVPDGLRKENLPQLLDHVLASRGFTTVRTPDSRVLAVVKLEQAAGIASPIADDDAGNGVLAAGFVTELIECRYIDPAVVATAIKPFMTRQGTAATPLGKTRLLAISDQASRMAEVRQLVSRLDIPDQFQTVQIDLEFLPASQAVSLVQELVKRRQAAGAHPLEGDLLAMPSGSAMLLMCRPESEPTWRALIKTVDHREPVESRTYIPRLITASEVLPLVENIGSAPTTTSGIVDERFRVSTDAVTGTLLVTATATQHERIAAALANIDSASQTPAPVRTFLVRNRPVREVLQTIERLITAGVIPSSSPMDDRALVTQGASQSSFRTPFPAPTAQPPAGGLPQPSTTTATTAPADSSVSAARSATASSQATVLTADESSNTLIAIGEPRVLDQIEAILKTLDVRQPQVMLEVLLVSLSDTEALSLGVELERLGSLNNASTQLSSIFGLTGGSAGARTVPDQAGFTGAVLNAGEFSVVVRALESINKGNSLSNPKLLVTNNERAVFSSTLQQPVTQQTRTGSNDTTFSYGGSESAGTTISVQPQISQGDHLALTYSIKLSSFVGTSTTAGLPPPKQENSVDSSATIPDGHTVVVGGMELITESEAIAQVPVLGSIPIIGELFKTRDRGSGRTRFYVFIRANVLRSGMLEDLKYISATDIAKVQGLGGRIDDGFPEVKARVIR